MVKVLAICFESPDNVFGGMGTHTRNLYANMDADITYLTNDLKISRHKTYKLIIPENITYFRPNKNDKEGWIRENHRRMFMTALKQDFDIIHAHDYTAVPIAFDVREITGKPIVTTFHLFLHQVIKVENFPPTNTHLYDICMEGNGIHQSDEVIVCSQNMQDYITDKFGIKRKVRVIPNAICLEEFDCEPMKFTCNKPIVLFSGRLSKQKGIEQLMDTVEQTDKYMFIVMGRIPAVEGGENYPYAIRLRQLQEKYPDRLIWLKHIEGKKRFKWFKRADIGIVPSLCEPFGIVALEFFASKTPLVTTAVDGMAEFVNEDNAFIIPDASVKSIIRGLEDADKSKVERGFEVATRRSWKDVAKETVRVYKEVLNGKNQVYQSRGDDPS